VSDHLAVDLASERGLGEPRPDGGGDLRDSDGLVELPDRSVRQRDGNHGFFLSTNEKARTSRAPFV